MTMSALSSQSETVSCPSGKTVSGGGASISPNTNAFALNESYPLTGSPSGWKVTYYNVNVGSSTTTETITVYAICSA